jgi:hypothetical protein
VSVEPTGQAHGKLVAGDTVVAINGNSVIGMKMAEAAKFVMTSDTVVLTLGDQSPKERSVTIDRSGGKKLGLRLGNAVEGKGVPVLSVDSEGISATVPMGVLVVAINGESVLGFKMKEAADLILLADLVTFTFVSAPESPVTKEENPYSKNPRKFSSGRNGSLLGKHSVSKMLSTPSTSKIDEETMASVRASTAKSAGDTVLGTKMGGVAQTPIATADAVVASPDSVVAISEASSTPSAGAVVVLDRSNGQKLGVRLGNAAGPQTGIPVISVDPIGQAAGKLAAGDTVVAINGSTVVGMKMKAAAGFLMKSDRVELTLGQPSA